MNASLTISQQTDTWSVAHFDGMEIGGFGETTRQNPDMRWYWSGQGTYGHCATQAEAVAELAALVPGAIERRRIAQATKAEFDALPAHLQELKLAMDSADFDVARAWGRQPFNEADWRSASVAAHEATVEFLSAQSEWQSQREAA